MSDPLISFDQVTYRYGREAVLENVSFEINAGEFVGIIGPNGSGKTTLLKLALGLLKPEKGEINVLGQPAKLGQSHHIGYIPQRITQLETRFPITVEEVVGLGHVKPSVIGEALAMVEMQKFRQRLITELSGGQQQRVFIAKALASSPQLLILDEPTVGVDVSSQESFYALLSKLNKEKGLTIVLVSHDVDVVVNEVNTVLCVNKTVIYHGNPQTFMKEDYLQKLYGKNRKYIIHGH